MADHGYRLPPRLKDPNGLFPEFSLDDSNVDEIDALRDESARRDLARGGR
jgi:hypothetical protein